MAKKIIAAKQYLSEDQKMGILKDYDTPGATASQVCKKHKISLSTLYNYKREYWEIYLSTKDTVSNIDKISTITNVKIDNSRRIAAMTRKSAVVIEKVLNILEYKLDIEEKRLQGDEDVTEDAIPMSDLTKFFQVAAPYFFKPLDAGNANKDMKNTHSYITNILNQNIQNQLNNGQ
jgi:transposase-like protein